MNSARAPSSLKFSGYTAVYEEARDDDKEEKTSPLPPLTEGQTLELQGFDEEQHFTQPPHALHRGDAHPRAGGEGHRPTLDLRAHGLDHHRP